MIGGAQSWAGPVLAGLGVLGLASGALVHGVDGKPSLWTTRREESEVKPSVWERLSVHLVASGAWSLFFGLMVWRGPAAAAWDVRLPGEATWPVWSKAEWFYVLGYLTPLVVAWVASTRGALRRFCGRLAVVSLVSGLCFWLLPVVSPPRGFDAEATDLTGKLLAMELGRADFGAVSLPSFHVFWAFLLAGVIAERGRVWRYAGAAWVMAMSAACVLNGAHAIADVGASWVIWMLLAAAEKAAEQQAGKQAHR